MADEPDNLVLQDLKRQMTNLEERMAQVELSIACVNRRNGRIEVPLDRMERRLDLVDQPH